VLYTGGDASITGRGATKTVRHGDKVPRDSASCEGRNLARHPRIWSTGQLLSVRYEAWA
jgi:hypothetical protein